MNSIFEFCNAAINFIETTVTDKILFRAFRISIVLNLAREVCGAVPVLNFAGDIFTKAADGGTGLVLTPNQQAMMLGTVQVAGSAVASSLVEKTGRKVCMTKVRFKETFTISCYVTIFRIV